MMMDQRGVRSIDGHGRITGNQNRRAVVRKHMCSTSCHVEEWSANSYISGECQAMLVKTNADQQKIGCDMKRPILPSRFDLRKGPTPSLKNLFGRPNKMGMYGALERISGGATIISKRC